MKHLGFIISVLLFSSVTFSQTKSENIKEGYLISFGTVPNGRQISQMGEIKNLDATSLYQVLNYFNDYIFKNRETIQREIIKRAFSAVFKVQPDSQEIEHLYSSTTKKGKNYTDLFNELNIYFTQDIKFPD